MPVENVSNMVLHASRQLQLRGLGLSSVGMHTPDGREWLVTAVPFGSGRRPDGSFGKVANARGGYRLFEIGEDDAPQEHDAVEGDLWEMGDLIDYVRAVGHG